ncbi:MAG TPA: TonB-dependent receptor [Candidatus Bathyarchaeia archaeon]|nr:TonB-dependent receptor [Candidatus Bathyarchaeia archaeon]
MRHAIGVAVMTVLFVAGRAAAQDAKPEEAKQPVAQKVDPVVVTATTVPTPAEQLGVSLNVITGEDFKTYHYNSVDDAFRNIPGVNVVQQGSYGKVSTLSIRGANASQVLILVDGVRVSSPTLGQTDLSDISPDMIERIEVIRGGQSTLYGADAIGGVVNIITKKGTGPFSAVVENMGGNYDTFSNRVAVNGAYKMVDYSLYGSHFESNGQFTNDNTNTNAAGGRVGITLPWDSALGVSYRYNKNDVGVPVKGVFPPPQPIVPFINPNAKQQTETTVLSVDARTHPVDWWEARGRFGRYTNNQGFQDPVDPGFDFDTPFRSQVDTERLEYELLNSIIIGPWSTSTVGFGYRYEHGDNQGVFQASQNVKWFMFEQQFRLFDRLFITGGTRIEDNSVFGTATTGQGSVLFVIKETGTRLRGSAGSGFRAPTFNDLFFPQFGNPNLLPERSQTWDIGLDQSLWGNRIRLKATYFHTNFTDAITCCVPLPTAPFGGPVNAGSARSRGVEASMDVDLLPNLVATFVYTYTDTDNFSTGRPLARIPLNSGSAGLTWEPLRGLSVFAQVYAVSRQFDTYGDLYNSGHTRVDAGGTYRLINQFGWLQRLDLVARAQNILNEAYAEVRGFPALGANFLIGLRAAF